MEFGNIPSAVEDVNHIAYYYAITQVDERAYLSLTNQNETTRETLQEELTGQPELYDSYTLL